MTNRRSYVMKEAPKASGGDMPDIDWDAVREQVPEGSLDARVAVVVDLGRHDRGKRVSDKAPTYVQTLDEANDLIDLAEELVGAYNVEKDGLDQIEDIDTVCKLPFKIVNDKWVFNAKSDPANVTFVHSEDEAEELLDKALILDEKGFLERNQCDTYEVMENCFKVPFHIYEEGEAQELGILVDLTDTYVTYVEGQEPKQYRVNLCPTFNGKMQGLKVSYKDGVYDPRSVIAKLCKATNNNSILKKGPDTNNIALLPGSPYFQVMEHTDTGFLKASKEFGTPRLDKDGNLKDEVAPLDIEGYPEGIFMAFDWVTADDLEAAKLNKLYVERIKSALNYEGSEMQKAFEELEARRSKAKQSSTDDDGDDDQEEEKTTTRRRSAKKAEEKVEEKPTRGRGRKAPTEPVEEEKKEEKPTTTRGRKRSSAAPEKATEPTTTSSRKRGRRVEKSEPEPEVNQSDDDQFDDDIPF